MKRLIAGVCFVFLMAGLTKASDPFDALRHHLMDAVPVAVSGYGQSATLQRTAGARVLSNGVAIPGDFPEIETWLHGPTAPGRLFISCTFFSDYSLGNYIIICGNDGLPWFYRRNDRLSYDGKGCADFRVQPNGYLSYHHYTESESGFHAVMDNHFTVLDTFKAVGNYRTDNHEFLLLENGHALLIAEEDKPTDMSQIVTGGQTNAILQGNHIQEVDADGNLYWEWKSWDHLDVTDAIGVNLKQFNIDYVHMNSIAIDYDGHYVLSLRYYNEVCKIDSRTGDFIWRLGGKNNEFTWIHEDTPFSSQHHAMPVPGKPDHYTIFDNNHARAVEYRLNIQAETAEKVWEYQYSKKRSSSMMGSVQKLSNGNTYIDWSDRPPLKACEVDSQDNLVFEMQVNAISGYRSYRLDWEGRMLKPDLIAETGSEGATLIFNQFGDPDVDYYKIYHGLEPGPTVFLDTSRLTLKTFGQLENKTYHYFRVTSVNKEGVESDTSNEAVVFIKIIAPGENQILNPDFSDSDRFWTVSMYGTVSAEGTVEDNVYRLKAESVSPGSGAYVYQYPVELIENETYIFEFDAWADKALQMYPYVVSGNGNSDYSRIGAIQVTAKHDHYSYTFTKKNGSTGDALVAFLIDAPGELYVDNVVLRQNMASNTDLQTGTLPSRYRLEPNFPNPFNASTVLGFSIPVVSDVTLTLYDILGKQVREIRKGIYQPGEYQVPFRDDRLSTGVYFYRIQAREPGGSQTFDEKRKMIFLK